MFDFVQFFGGPLDGFRMHVEPHVERLRIPCNGDWEWACPFNVDPDKELPDFEAVDYDWNELRHSYEYVKGSAR